MANEWDRRDRRYRFEVSAAILSRSRTVPAVTEDVSFRGAFLRTTAKIVKRELVRARFTLPGARMIVIHGMAVNVVGPDEGEGHAEGVGLEFYGLDGEPRILWEKLITSVRERAGDVSQVVALPRAPAAVARPELPVRVATSAALERFVGMDLARMIFIRTSEVLEVGTEVVLRLVHPDHCGTFALDCVVRRRMFGTHAGVGVELLFVNEELRRALAEFVRPLASDVDVVLGEVDDAPVIVRRDRAS